MHRVLLVLAGLLLTSPFATAQELWGGLSAGMTVEQVRAAYPHAKEKEQEAPSQGKPPRYSAVLVVPDLTYADRPYEALVSFKPSTGLAEVMLRQAKKFERKGEAWEIAQSLLVSLRQKYGKEIHAELNKREFQFIITSEWQWVSGDTSVLLSTMEWESLRELNAGTTVTYTPGAKKDASKL
jgi:hypothetical protein